MAGPGSSAGVSVDLDHGGRWTSLRLAGREWLWSREDPRRDRVAPGEPFVDAGGLEECVPTVRGEPDHGSAWSRPWRDLGSSGAEADCGPFTLRRCITLDGDRVTARYRLQATPGYRFVWAAHALIDVSDQATLLLPAATTVRIYPEAADLLAQPWPAGAPFMPAPWPGAGDLRLDRLGPDDGSAVGAIALSVGQVTVYDGNDRLWLQLRSELELPTSVGLWRNLRGFPVGSPYRSIGIEPMLGSVFDLAEASSADDAVTVPASGSVEWELQIAAFSSAVKHEREAA
ncbi:MAG: hypothetical protein J2P27_05790 [Actinobacteria bacterium]|nr:hypothetical protein [Actinomycetota bacterium]